MSDYWHKYAAKEAQPNFGFAENAQAIEARFTMNITIKTNSLAVTQKLLGALKEAGIFADATGQQYAWGYAIDRNPEVK